MLRPLQLTNSEGNPTLMHTLCNAAMALGAGNVVAGAPTLLGFLILCRLMSLQAMSPLVLTLAQTLDPVIGSLLGWGFGLMAAPGPLTYAGGGVLLGATAYVTIAGGRRRKQETEMAVKAEVVSADGSGHEASEQTDGLLSARV